METYQYGLKRGGSHSDQIMKYVLLAVSSAAVLIVLLIILFTVANSWTSITEVGILDFIFGDVWAPGREQYGALPLILGTILVTLGSMVFAVPVGIACAIYISEIAPAKTRNILKPMVELFSAIPSVVYGFIGMVVLIPILKALFPDQQLFSNSWLAASLILGIMAMPTIISVSEDAIHSVPQSYREASQAMGATKWETIIKVIVPAAISGISAAIILGIGRAIGETMAVLMLTGNSPVIPSPLWNVFGLISTLTGTIALQLPESAAGSVTQSSLFELGVVLMIMVLIINVCSRYVIKRTDRKLGNVDPTKSLMYRITGKTELVPTNIADKISEHRGLLMMLSIYVLLFIGVWMFASLLTSDVIALVAAVVVVAVIALVVKAFSGINSTERQKICFGGLTVVMGFVVLILVVIIGYILLNGLPVIDWEFLTTSPTSGGRDGGIFPAIVGSLELIAGTALIAFPLGILTGIYLNEYARNTPYTRVIREAIDLLNGTPSIVFGMFGMIIFVRYAGLGYSMLAGWVTLAFMILPVIIRTTEEAMKSVPPELREASRAMGATKWKTIYKVVVPAAMGGIVTGSILSIGRAAGETAPIMLTAAVISQPHLADTILDPVMALPLHLYHLAMDLPGTTDLQYGTATVLLFIVLIFFVAASLIRSHYNKKVRW
mgnify:CR=1 FL=1